MIWICQTQYYWVCSRAVIVNATRLTSPSRSFSGIVHGGQQISLLISKDQKIWSAVWYFRATTRDLTPAAVKINGLPHDKTNKTACAPSEDSDQPGHLPSLIRVFTVRMLKAWTCSYPFVCTVKTLIWLGGCPSWSESSLGAKVILLDLSWGGSFCFKF